MRIGFLFNHDQVHQVAHGLPIALAMAKGQGDAEIILCSTNERITNELKILGGPAVGRELKLVELRLVSPSSRFVDAVAGRLIPSAKLLIYRDNLDFFKSLDVLVVPEKTSLLLKDHFHLDHLKIIHTRHGAGDRAVGFDKASARFDHILASGSKIRERLVRDAGVPPDKISIVGYPKFDLFEQPDMNLGPRTRPVVVYNPHVAPHLSSWYKAGRAILRWFASNPSYDFIFAPHIMLFERRFVVTIQPFRIGLPGRVRQGDYDRERIRIDTHSRALTTMEYLNQADIYLGDASSQVYEFLEKPRPCLFFNAHGFEWTENQNFAHWHAGRVLSEVGQLEGALASAFEDHENRYRAAQLDMLRYTFDLNDTPSSIRAADAIMAVAGGSSRKPGTRRGGRPDGDAQIVPTLAAAMPS